MEENISEAPIVLNRNTSFLQSQVGAVLWSLVLLSLLQTAGLSSCCVLAQPRAEEIKTGNGILPSKPSTTPGSAYLKVRYSPDSSNAPGSQHDRMGDHKATASLPGCLLHCVELFSAQDPNLRSSDSPSRLLKLTVQWMSAVPMNLLSISSADHTLLLRISIFLSSPAMCVLLPCSFCCWTLV